MKISVIGSIVYDDILGYDGSRRESFGGITYNVAALSSIVDEDTEVQPITNIGEDRFDAIMELLARYPQVRSTGIARTPGHVTTARLEYKSPTFREEAVLYLMQPLTAERLQAARGSDATLVNFITGNEMEFPAFASLCDSAPGYLHFDVHNRISTFDERGQKAPRAFDDWREWLRRVNAAQMNEFEAEQLIGRKLATQDDYVATAVEMVEGGVPIVLITLGPQGSVLAYRRDDGVYWVANPALEVEKVVDTTGCGDSFSGGFIWNYLQSRNPVQAQAAANIVAGVNCTVAGIGHLEAGRDALAKVAAAFADLGPKIMSGWAGNRA